MSRAIAKSNPKMKKKFRNPPKGKKVTYVLANFRFYHHDTYEDACAERKRLEALGIKELRCIKVLNVSGKELKGKKVIVVDEEMEGLI